MLAKRFPFAIYYDVSVTSIVVVAVLDLRRNPKSLHQQLNRTTYSKKLNQNQNYVPSPPRPNHRA
jgi:hypothetical protein